MYQTSLFQRLSSWINIFSKREDIEFDYPSEKGPKLGNPIELPITFPEEIIRFAKEASQVAFCFRAKEQLFDEDKGFIGSIELNLSSSYDDPYMVINGEEIDDEIKFPLETDMTGSGLASWIILDEKQPFIIWDLESCILFQTFNDYITSGARRGFTSCWQNREENENYLSLLKCSLPLDTSPSILKEKILKCGETEEMADDLFLWLGTSTALLFANSKY